MARISTVHSGNYSWSRIRRSWQVNAQQMLPGPPGPGNLAMAENCLLRAETDGRQFRRLVRFLLAARIDLPHLPLIHRAFDSLHAQ